MLTMILFLTAMEDRGGDERRWPISRNTLDGLPTRPTHPTSLDQRRKLPPLSDGPFPLPREDKECYTWTR